MNRQQKASDQISRHEETAYICKLPGQMWPATEAWSASVQHGMDINIQRCVSQTQQNFIMFIIVLAQ